MFRSHGASLFRDGRRFAKSTITERDSGDEQRLCIEGLGVELETLIADKHGNIILIKENAFDNSFASGSRPPVWLNHDKTKVVGPHAELCLLKEGVAFRLPLSNSANARLAKEMIETGDQTSVSIGFTKNRTHDEIHFGHNVQYVDEATIDEISIVSYGASKNAFCRIIDANFESPLHESVNTTMFGLEYDMHSIKRLSCDNQIALQRVTRDLLLLQDEHQDSDEPITLHRVSDIERIEALQRARRAALGLSIR